MNNATIAAKTPIKVKLEKGKKYFWCSCGKSSKQPFCDGSHVGTNFLPKSFVAEEDEEVFLCQCKQTKNPPFCDGTHKSIT